MKNNDSRIKIFYLLLASALTVFFPFFSHGEDVACTDGICTSVTFASTCSTVFTAEKKNVFTVKTLPEKSGSSIRLSSDSILPEGVSFIDNGDGTATLIGIPQHHEKTDVDYPLIFIASDPNTLIADQYQCELVCRDFGGTICEASCYGCVQNFILTVHSSPCYFINENSAIFPREGGSFPIEVSSAYNGTIVLVGDFSTYFSFLQHPFSENEGLLIFNPPDNVLLPPQTCYDLHFTFSSKECSCQQVFFARIGSSECLRPPRQVSGEIQPDPIQTFGATKQQSDFQDVIKWKAPKRGNIIGYNIFSDSALRTLVSSVATHRRSNYKVTIPFANPCRTKIFYIVSVDDFGRKSKPVKIKIKGTKADCKTYRKGHKQRENSSANSSSL